MLLGIVADTHDHRAEAARAVALLRERGADALLHAGDVVAPFTARVFADAGLPVHAVLGNNDGEVRGLAAVLPSIARGPLTLALDGRSVGLVHDIETLAPDEWQAWDLLVHGHTHRPEITQRDGVRLVNPGEASGVLHGRPTAALLDTRTLHAEILAL